MTNDEARILEKPEVRNPHAETLCLFTGDSSFGLRTSSFNYSLTSTRRAYVTSLQGAR